MTFSDAVNVVLTLLASTGIAGGIIFGLSNWLGKIWAERILQRESAKLRQELFTFETRFSRLHQRQAEIIAEMYSKIIDFTYAAHDYVNSSPKNEGHEEVYHQRQRDLIFYFDKHKIYFPEPLSESLMAFVKKVREKAITKMVWGTLEPDEYPEDRRERLQRLRIASEELERDMPTLLRQLEDQFRHILGVKEA